MTTVRTVISGGQTGADRAGLDAAIALGLRHGGWVPRGRRAEDGVVPAMYDLKETHSASYPVRTQFNIEESDGTVVFTRGAPERGSALTMELCQQLQKPFIHVDVGVLHAGTDAPALTAYNKDAWSSILLALREWIAKHGIRVLNVAGNRESVSPGIHDEVKQILKYVFWPVFDPGTKVLTVEVDNPPTDWVEEVKKLRRFGVIGVVVQHHDSHGQCYDVRHDDDGTVGPYEPKELKEQPA